MAVAKVKKFQLIGLNDKKDELLKNLEEASLVQVEIKEENAKKILQPEKIAAYISDKNQEIEEQLNKVNFLLKLVKIFSKKETSLLSSFLPPKAIVKKSEYDNILATYSLGNLYRQMEEADVLLREADNSITQLNENNKTFLPWQGTDFNTDTTQTKTTKVFYGVLANSKKDDLITLLNKKDLVHYRVISSDKSQSYLVLFIHKDNTEDVLKTAALQGFQAINLPSTSLSVKDTIKQNTLRIKQLKADRKSYLDTLNALAGYERQLQISQSYLQSKQSQFVLEGNLLHTKNVFVVEGWIKAVDDKKFQKRVENITNQFVLNFSEPGPKDNPPIILENPAYLKPFEAITALYGMPSQNELDPTPYLAPFFLVFFGLAIGDAVYGLAVSFICVLLNRSKKFSKNSKLFFQLFFYGGISAFFFGVITGSWLTLDPALLPQFLKNLIVFDPLANPVLFLVITLILGIIQIYFGFILSLINIGRNEGIVKALMLQLPPLLLLPGVALLVARLLGTPLSDTLYQAAVYLSLAGAAGVILFSETEAKNIFTRIFGGLYNLYGMSSLIGDVISYGRIMALGLATFLIGSSFNGIVLGGSVVKSLLLKIILAILLLPFVHVFNLAINVIGAFVHPVRLQYVEFFGKFYEGGGKKFKPLAVKTDNIILE